MFFVHFPKSSLRLRKQWHFAWMSWTFKSKSSCYSDWRQNVMIEFMRKNFMCELPKWRRSFQKSCWLSSPSGDYVGFIPGDQGCVPSNLVYLWVSSAVYAVVAGSEPPSEHWKTFCWVCSALCAFFLTVSGHERFWARVLYFQSSLLCQDLFS